MNKKLPSFPYGAVYFRKSNPPKDDWERDYGTAAEDGMNTFRHWFFWSTIEVAPGVYNWDDYDRQLDLAAQNGIKTIIAEMITLAPEWAYRKYAHARYETRDGRKLDSRMHPSCAVGGAPGLCLDNDDVKEVAGNFLKILATRYKGHPGLGGYDIWNECNYDHNTCYCPATAEKFRHWLKDKYGDVQTLATVWRRYSYVDWEDVVPPRTLEPYPDSLDWLQFRIDNAYSLMRWRKDVIRAVDDEAVITAHGIAASLRNLAPGGSDDWRAAAEVEVYGLTWGSSRHGDEPWKQSHAMDLVRASSRGKPFWHAEAYAGPLWLQPNVLNKPRNEGRIASPEDIRYWDLSSFMAGAKGLMYLRWRPLLDGPLFGAFGGYGMDGSRTARSEMVSKVAKWVTAPEQENLWQSHPVQGDVGIIFVPESQMFNYVQQGNTDFYRHSMEGAYQGFFDANIQADWVHIDDIDINVHQLLYLPYPTMLTQKTADSLKQWVHDGGILVSEGCPAYFGDGAHVGTVQPNLGLDTLFGAVESYVEFTPDLLGDMQFNLGGIPVYGSIFLQAYAPTTGVPVGWYDDGSVAVIDNRYGKGKTRLIGTMVGAGYWAHPDVSSPSFFQEILRFADKTQHVLSSNPKIKARIHSGSGGIYLWVANPSRQDQPVRLNLADTWGEFSSSHSLWGNKASVSGQVITLIAGARDVTVLRLE